MSRTILFSPLGQTDPISPRNHRDGAMLHICRIYRPDIIYLYLSQQILAEQRCDERFTTALKRLQEEFVKRGQPWDYKLQLIKRPKLYAVQDFNYFYGDFRQELLKICADLAPEDTLLINTSSGTPAIKSALVVLATLGEIPCRLLQVTNPEFDKKKSGKPQLTPYNLNEFWRNNPDNTEPVLKKRITEVNCTSLRVFSEEQLLLRFIKAFDYHAACSLAESLPPERSAPYLEYLKLARERELLNRRQVRSLEDKLQADFIPFRSKDKMMFFEYALYVQLKLERGEYTDFLRALTPLIAETFERLLIKQANFNLNCWIVQKPQPDKAGGAKRMWDRGKICQSAKAGNTQAKALEAVFASYGKRQSNDISSDALKLLLEELCGDTDFTKLAQALRRVEKNVRNLAAHEIVSLTAESIKAMAGFSPAEIMQLIKDTLAFTDLEIKPNDERWNSYQDMNKAIAQRINPYPHA